MFTSLVLVFISKYKYKYKYEYVEKGAVLYCKKWLMLSCYKIAKLHTGIRWIDGVGELWEIRQGLGR